MEKPPELVTMSTKEIDRLEVIRRVLEHGLKRRKAAQLLGITSRQVWRLCETYKSEGPAGLASKRRGRPSNRRLWQDLEKRTVELVRELYGDFGPTLAREGTNGLGQGVTQFGRALSELNIDSICANTPQAKGRVERMNSTLQDRLVKKLRLQGISTMEAGNAFAPKYMEDFNRRFAKPPRNPHDAHRPVDEKVLEDVFAWREERRMTRNLVVHFKRVSYLVEPTPEALKLGGQKVQVREWQDWSVEISCDGVPLPYAAVDKQPHVAPGDIVDNKRLGAILVTIQDMQTKRDEARLASPKVKLADKERLRAKRLAMLKEKALKAKEPRPAHPPKVVRPERITLAGVDPNSPVQAFLDRFAVEQAERRRKYNEAGNDRTRAREFMDARSRPTS